MVLVFAGRHILSNSRPRIHRAQDVVLLSSILGTTLFVLSAGTEFVCFGNVVSQSTFLQDFQDCVDDFKDKTSLAMPIVTLIFLLGLGAMVVLDVDTGVKSAPSSKLTHNQLLRVAFVFFNAAAFSLLWGTYHEANCADGANATFADRKDCAEDAHTRDVIAAVFAGLALALVCASTGLNVRSGEAHASNIYDWLLAAGFLVFAEALFAATVQSARASQCEVDGFSQTEPLPDSCKADNIDDQANAVAATTIVFAFITFIATYLVATKQGIAGGDQYQSFAGGPAEGAGESTTTTRYGAV